MIYARQMPFKILPDYISTSPFLIPHKSHQSYSKLLALASLSAWSYAALFAALSAVIFASLSAAAYLAFSSSSSRLKSLYLFQTPRAGTAYNK